MIYFEDVAKFHNKFGLVSPPQFSNIPSDLRVFRVKFLQEELQEYQDSCVNLDLGTAVDSLIDLVYVCIGTALLHGITRDEFIKSVIDEDHLNPHEPWLSADAMVTCELFTPKPTYLSPKGFISFMEYTDKLIKLYEKAAETGDEFEVRCLLACIFNTCISCSDLMGVTPEAWDEMWADVQRANMAKERVLNASDSKRGSTWDVRKPEGWIAPRTHEILETYL